VSECKHEFIHNEQCSRQCRCCGKYECDVLRKENERMKMKLLEKDDELCGENARLEHEVKKLRKWREAGKKIIGFMQVWGHANEHYSKEILNLLRDCEGGEKE